LAILFLRNTTGPILLICLLVFKKSDVKESCQICFNIENKQNNLSSLCCLFPLYEADFIHGLLKKNGKKLTRYFNFTLRYIDDLLSLNNSKLGDFVDCIYPIELDIV
jgi:hypothetical protein